MKFNIKKNLLVVLAGYLVITAYCLIFKINLFLPLLIYAVLSILEVNYVRRRSKSIDSYFINAKITLNEKGHQFMFSIIGAAASNFILKTSYHQTRYIFDLDKTSKLISSIGYEVRFAEFDNMVKKTNAMGELEFINSKDYGQINHELNLMTSSVISAITHQSSTILANVNQPIITIEKPKKRSLITKFFSFR